MKKQLVVMKNKKELEARAINKALFLILEPIRNKIKKEKIKIRIIMQTLKIKTNKNKLMVKMKMI